jgi:hypothetical protein
VFGALVVLVKKNRNLEKDVVIYSLGNKHFLHEDDSNDESEKLLHRQQIVQDVDSKDDLATIEVPFPKNVRNYFYFF